MVSICKIGSLTGYPIGPDDIDLRGTGKSFSEALEIAFRMTKVPRDFFEPEEWAKDLNGKSGVVVWRAPNAEVNIDAPHKRKGPDVFHIGFKSGKGKNRIKGHVFVDCVPYFREIKDE